jgi:multiple sugar transport system permease protein
VLIAPAMLVVAAVTLVPLLSSLVTSFRDWRLTKSPRPGPFVGLSNYSFALEDPEFWASIYATIVFVVADVVATLVIALGLALALRRAGVLQRVTRALLIVPFAMSPALIGVSFRFMFNAEHGVLSKGLGWLIPPLKDVIWLAHPTWSMVAMVFSDVWHWAPYMTLVVLGGLASIPVETEEAARTDGATEWQVLRDVTVPQLMPVLAVVAVLKTVFALKMFDNVVTLTGGGPGTATQTLAYFVYSIAFKWYDMGYASAVAYVLTIMLVALAFVYMRQLLPRKSGGGHG